MATGESSVVVEYTATSIADDLGFVAMSDLSAAIADRDHRLIGGHMVTAHASRWRLGAELFRETGDTDLGVPPVAVNDDALIETLEAMEYRQLAGNRFGREVTDIPVTTQRNTDARLAVVDLLVPNYTSRRRQNVVHGERLVTTQVPGLATALARPPVVMTFELTRLNGAQLSATLAVADEASALVLKSHATTVREKATDVVDVWRCLEIGLAAGVQPSDFDRDKPSTESRVILKDLFATRSAKGMASLVAEQRLSSEAADGRYTRIRALLQRVVG